MISVEVRDQLRADWEQNNNIQQEIHKEPFVHNWSENHQVKPCSVDVREDAHIKQVGSSPGGPGEVYSEAVLRVECTSINVLMIAIVDPNDLLLPTAALCHNKFKLEVKAAANWHGRNNLRADLNARK